MGINLNPSSHSNYSTVPNLSLASITLDFFTEKAKRETEKDRQASEEREVQRIREVMYEEKRRKNRRFITECGHAFTFAEKNDHFARFRRVSRGRSMSSPRMTASNEVLR